MRRGRGSRKTGGWLTRVAAEAILAAVVLVAGASPAFAGKPVRTPSLNASLCKTLLGMWNRKANMCTLTGSTSTNGTGSFTIPSGTTLVVAGGVFQINAGVTVTNSGTITNQAGLSDFGTIDNRGVVNNTNTPTRGTLLVGNTNHNGTFTNESGATVTTDGELDVCDTLTNQANGTIANGADGIYAVATYFGSDPQAFNCSSGTNGAMVNDGTFTDDGVLKLIGGSLINDSTGALTLGAGASVTTFWSALSAKLVNHGQVDNRGGSIGISDRFPVTNDGTFTNELGGTIANESGTFTNLATGTLNNDAEFDNTTTSQGDVATLANHGTATITNTSNGIIHNIDSVVNGNPWGGAVQNAGTLTNQSGGTVTNDAHGTIDNASGANFANHGSVDNSGTVTDTSGGALPNDGAITNGSGSQFTSNGLTNDAAGTIDNAGTMAIGAVGAHTMNHGSITNVAGGSLIAELDNFGQLTNFGTAASATGNNESTGTITNESTGTFSTGGSSVTGFTNIGTVNNHGTLTQPQGNYGDFTNGSGGTVDNHGTIDSVVTFDNYSTITNESDGTINAGGNFTNQSGGTLTNHGTITVWSQLTNLSGGTFTNASDGTIYNNFELVNFGSMLNDGLINEQSSNGVFNDNGGVLTNHGTIDDHFRVNNASGATIENLSGAITVELNASMKNSGFVDNQGSITNNGTFSQCGSFSGNAVSGNGNNGTC